MKTSNESIIGQWLLHYDQPATQWPDGLPLANGRIGAMVFGGVRVERLYLSETTFWSGEPSTENNNRQGPRIFAEVRKHLLARDMAAANQLAHALEGRKLNYGTNLPFGNLRLLFDHEETAECAYCRELDLDTALVRIRYEVDHLAFQREIFVSAPHQVIAIRLTGSQPARLTCQIALDGDEQPYTIRTEGSDTILMDNRALESQHSNGQVGVAGHARLYVRTEGGQASAVGSQLTIQQADSVTILIAMATSFAGSDPAARCREAIAAASGISYEALRSAHIAEHQSWFRRAELDLGEI